MTLGTDYAFYAHPSPSALQAAGVRFACRYISSYAPNDLNGKNLLKPELTALLGAGLSVVVVAEEGGSDMLGGHAAGVTRAQHADAVVKALGMPGIPVYFACDFDATPADQGPINAYLDGAASVIGHGRTGIYGGFWPLSRALDAGKAAWAWQTLAWSGGFWDNRADIRQGLSFSVGGVSVDVDHSMDTDFGQWPRPKPPAPVPTKPVPPKLFLADGVQSLRQAAHAHGTTVQRAIWLMAAEGHAGDGGFGQPNQAVYVATGDWNAPMPKNMVYWAG